MISLPQPTKITKKGPNKSVFEIAGLYPGYGVTIGNSLRRVLLSSLEGSAVTEVKIKGASHEFSTISGVLEDVITVILNLKNLRFKIHDGEIQKAELKVKGEKKVTGADFKTPSQMDIVNPDFHIATITSPKTELEIEIVVERGVGYEPVENRQKSESAIGKMAIDAIFTPIKNVNFYVENMRVGDRTDFDKLSLEIETDGIVTPEEAFYQSCEILINHFNIINNKEDLKPEKKPSVKASSPVEDKQDNTKTSVEDLGFSGRTQNALLNNSIKTVGGIIKKSETQLSELEGVGETAITEIKKKLKKLGLELKSE